LIDEYNAGSINIEVFFQQLMEFAKKLNEEDGRKISEQLTEEELALFDLLKKAGLKNKERQQVKLAAKDLLKKLKQEKLVLDWRRKQQARAEVLFTIETVLDEILPDPPYTKAIYEETCNDVYQHVYDSYYGAGRSIYA
jgi:type I restriction enzyme R subunit